MIGAYQQSLASRRERVHVDVCVIGAGIAGLTAATRIAAALARPVALVESGGLLPDPQITALDAIDDPEGIYLGKLRHRGIGGTSALWAGKLLPLSPHDMGARPHLGLDAWPIDPGALSLYTPEVEALLGASPGAYEGDDAALDPGGRLPRTPDDLVWRWPKHPARSLYRIDHAMQGRLAKLNNMTTWTNATVTTLTAAEGRLASVTATNHQGGELVVEAKRFVLAAGTLETTRLLLMADAQNAGIISRTTDALGRYFNDHFGLDAAIVRRHRSVSINRALADRVVNGTKRHLHGELARAVQVARGTTSAYFDMAPHFPAHSSILAARAMVKSLNDRQLVAGANHLIRLARNGPAVAHALFWKQALGQQYWPAQAQIRTKVWIEQLPSYANRLTLGSRRDSLGQSMLSARVRLSDADDHTARTMVEALRRFWERDMAHCAALHWTLPANGRLIDVAGEQAHPAGSTRMGRDAATSVVDAALRVHALPNVHVASASVFPSSGSANPTLTIMQLAMLTADEIIRAAR